MSNFHIQRFLDYFFVSHNVRAIELKDEAVKRLGFTPADVNLFWKYFDEGCTRTEIEEYILIMLDNKRKAIKS